MKKINKFALAYLMLTASFLLIFKCHRTEYDSSEGSFPWWSSINPGTQNTYAITITLTDMGNGTVRVLKTSGGYSYIDTLVKKCLQGQTYAGASNNCRGNAGTTAENQYGATALQYCSVNNNSCNDTYGRLNNLGVSAAYDSCNVDNTAGKTWRVAYSSVLEAILKNSSLNSAFPELGTNLIWANYYYSDTQGRVNKYGAVETYDLKTASHLVLCQQTDGKVY